MIAQTVADILGHHVTLTVEGIDRMYLNVYVPDLQHEHGVVGFFRGHRGHPLPSGALMRPMSRGFVKALEHFVAEHDIPLLSFRKGDPVNSSREQRDQDQDGPDTDLKTPPSFGFFPVVQTPIL